jgi:hypothetical protein
MIWFILRLAGIKSELLEPEDAAAALLEREVTVVWRPTILEKANPNVGTAVPDRAKEQEVRRARRTELLGRAGTLPEEGAASTPSVGGVVPFPARKRSR